MRQILESAIRKFIAEGSGISTTDVVPGLTSAAAPDGLYASLVPISERRLGQPVRKQRIGDTASYTQQFSVIEATFSIQWYREGAIEAAQSFVDFACSETGLTWATTSIVDGRIAGVNVYAGGSGYVTGDSVTLSATTEPSPTIEATGVLEANYAGQAAWITLLNNGAGYWDVPNVIISSSAGTGAVTSPRGFGFVVKTIPTIRNLTDEFSGDFEERAQIDLTIQYERPYNDRLSGRVERIIGERETDGAIAILDSEGTSAPTPPTSTGDRIMYLFQTNLRPQSTDSLTMVGGPDDGIAIDRIAEWTANGITIPATGNGFAEISLFSQNPIAPQHGRDIVRTSPFITQYEGHVTATIPSVTAGAYTGIYYVKTTHYIPNQPNITSVRAFKHTAFTLGAGLSVPVALADFNSHVILNNDIPNGGVIGLQIQLGFAVSRASQADIDQLLKELNTQTTPSITPDRDITFNLAGFNSRVTFMQFDLTSS